MIDIHDLLSRRLPEMAASAPTVTLFLRFVNPSIVSPDRYMLGKRHSAGTQKIATVIAKNIQVPARLIYIINFCLHFVIIF